MSGGHWDYCQYRIRDNLSDIADDPQVAERFPLLAKRFEALSHALCEVIHDLDWDLSFDQSIKDDRAFEVRALDLLDKEIAK